MMPNSHLIKKRVVMFLVIVIFLLSNIEVKSQNILDNNAIEDQKYLQAQNDNSQNNLNQIQDLNPESQNESLKNQLGDTNIQTTETQVPEDNITSENNVIISSGKIADIEEVNNNSELNNINSSVENLNENKYSEMSTNITNNSSELISENETQEISSNENQLPNNSQTSDNSQSSHEDSKNINSNNNYNITNQTFQYYDIDQLNNKTLQIINNPDEEKVKIICSNNNIIEFEGLLPNSTTCDQIKKIEYPINESYKEVIINSEKHIIDPLTIYTDIPEILKDKKDSVKVYWVNESNETIEITDIQFYENENGMYGRISWIVPHLSEQKFLIKFYLETENSSQNLDIYPLIYPNGTVENPIIFQFNIDYIDIKNVNCKLIIGWDAYILSNLSNQTFSTYNLPNGDYNWMFFCKDENSSNEKAIQGNFTVNESFSVDIPYKLYFIGETPKINIHSNKNINATIILEQPSNPINYRFNITNNSEVYTLDLINLTKEGFYKLNVTFNNLAQPYYIIKNFSVAKVEINLNKNNIEIGENLITNVNIISSIENITSILLKFGDGNANADFSSVNINSFNANFNHNYTSFGDYTIRLETRISNRDFIIQKNIHVNQTSKDKIAPKIYLLNPEDGKVINHSSLTFSYNAEDNVRISNCTFEIFNNSNFGTNIYSRIDYNPANNQTVEIPMQGFDPGQYTWWVTCYDNSSNNDYENRDFTILLNSTNSLTQIVSTTNNQINATNKTYEKKDLIDSAMNGLKDLLQKKDSFSIDQQEVLDDLGISKNLDYFNKRLVQIDQDLGNNLAFMTDSASRENKKKELYNEVENIKSQIPKNINVLDTNEYVKNSLTENLENIVKVYLDYKKINSDKSIIKSLADSNYKLQSFLTYSTKVKQVEITYLNDTIKKITLIRKKISIKEGLNDTTGDIFESIPKEIANSSDDITFLTKTEIINKDPLIRISLNDLDNKTLIYYINNQIDTKKIEKTDTLLFKQFEIKKINITGFYLFGIDNLKSLYIILIVILLVIIIIFLIRFILKVIKITKWKKEENVRKIFDFIKETKKLIKKQDLEPSRENYHKIRELYPLIPEDCKKYLFKIIKNIRTEIDRKDIFELIKEYKKAKKENRSEDEKRIYENIKDTYKRLPKKYRKKVFKKVIKDRA